MLPRLLSNYCVPYSKHIYHPEALFAQDRNTSKYEEIDFISR